MGAPLTQNARSSAGFFSMWSQRNASGDVAEDGDSHIELGPLWTGEWTSSPKQPSKFGEKLSPCLLRISNILNVPIWGFPEIGVPPNVEFIRDNPLFQETSICFCGSSFSFSRGESGMLILPPRPPSVRSGWSERSSCPIRRDWNCRAPSASPRCDGCHWRPPGKLRVCY